MNIFKRAWGAFCRWVLCRGTRPATYRQAPARHHAAKALVERIERATRTNIGIDFGVPLEERYRGVTTGLAPGVVRDKNPLPKGRGTRRREARMRKGGK